MIQILLHYKSDKNLNNPIIYSTIKYIKINVGIFGFLDEWVMKKYKWRKNIDFYASSNGLRVSQLQKTRNS